MSDESTARMVNRDRARWRPFVPVPRPTSPPAPQQGLQGVQDAEGGGSYP